MSFSYVLLADPAVAAVTTEVQLCNIALGRVGVRARIESLEDAGEEAEACALHYAQQRDLLLTAYPWPFATLRSVLALVAGATRTGWAYVYALPTGCLRPQYLWAGKRNPRPDERVAFRVESSDTGAGRVLLTDQEDAELVYTTRVATVAELPAYFVDALAWALAAELALVLPVKESLEERARRRAEASLARAAALASQEEGPDPEPESELLAVRG